jgi:hypothetical protein
MSGGAVGGVTTPLGTGPKAGAGGGNIYKSSKSTDKKHRSKGTKKKTTTKSVQYYLQHGPAKSNKRSLKENYSFLFEAARSLRIPDLKKSEIVAYLNYLKGEATDNIQFSVTEKIAGQAMNVGIRLEKDDKGKTVKMVYCSTKQGFSGRGEDYFAYSNKRSGSATSKLVRQAFIKNFRKSQPLQPGEEIKLNIEVIKSDDKKPDFISYEVPQGTETIAVFGMDPPGSFTKQDAIDLSGRYARDRNGPGGELTVLLPEDIPLQPNIAQNEEIISEIDDLILAVQNAPKGRGSDPDKPNMAHIRKYIAPRIRQLTSLVFPSSNLNPNSPIEAAAVNMTRDGQKTFFKVPNEDFNAIQRVQSSVYAEFRSNEIRIRGRRYMSTKQYYAKVKELEKRLSDKRIDSFLNQLDNPDRQSFAYNVFKYVKFINDINILKNNFVTFFSPSQLDSFCSLMLQGLQNRDRNKIKSAIELFGKDGKNNYSSNGNEEFKSENTEALVQFIDQNNLI